MAPSNPVRIVDANGNPITAANPLSVSAEIEVGDSNIGNVDVLTQPDSRESWRVSLVADEAANDSDKTFTVPASTEYQILWLWVELTTSADVGARQLEVRILDSADDVIGSIRAGITQAASLTYNYLFALGVPDGLSLRDGDLVNVMMPPLFLAPGQKLRVLDNNAIAAAADDMVVQMQIASRSVA